MDMEVYFPGNKKVYAKYKGFVIETDQPVKNGGDGSAPTPFDLFIASLGTCAGVYVLDFLTKRSLPSEGAGLHLSMEQNPDTHLITKIKMQIKLPPDFPEKYRDAVIRAAELCAVKRHLGNPPTFEITTTVG